MNHFCVIVRDLHGNIRAVSQPLDYFTGVGACNRLKAEPCLANVGVPLLWTRTRSLVAMSELPEYAIRIGTASLADLIELGCCQGGKVSISSTPPREPTVQVTVAPQFAGYLPTLVSSIGSMLKALLAIAGVATDQLCVAGTIASPAKSEGACHGK